MNRLESIIIGSGGVSGREEVNGWDGEDWVVIASGVTGEWEEDRIFLGKLIGSDHPS